MSHTAHYIYPSLDLNIQEKPNDIEASVIASLAQADPALHTYYDNNNACIVC